MDITYLSTPVWYRLTLSAGADLFQALKDFLEKEHLKEAFLLSCIGSLEKVVLAYPKTKTIPPEIETMVLNGLFEINGISGNIKKVDDKIHVHLHGSISKGGKEVSGGAIVSGTKIFKMAELVIMGFKE